MSTRNDERAARAQSALETYIRARGEVFARSSYEVADLMADLLHLVSRLDDGDQPIESTLRLALLHFEAEIAGEDHE